MLTYTMISIHSRLNMEKNTPTVNNTIPGRLYLWKNKQKFDELNKLYAAGEISFKSDPNKYSDMTPKEIQSTMNGYKLSKMSKPVCINCIRSATIAID